jgi:hypothetical protein
MFVLNFSTSFADADYNFAEIKPVARPQINLAPVSPIEADFSDIMPEATAINTKLFPVTPNEAPFDDETYQGSINEEQLLNALSPSAPKEADFEDTI